MRIAVLSDIHGNSDAFLSVINAIKEIKPERIVILGDIVGYGAEPSTCLRLVRELTEDIVAGNHDYGVAELTPIDYFNHPARLAIEWTKKKLETNEIVFLRNLPLSFTFDNFLFLHSSPDEPSEWTYIFDDLEASRQFKYFTEKILFVGHTHIPVIWVENGNPIEIEPDKSVELEKGRRYIINVGSVGQPRDGNPKASFGVFDTYGWIYTGYRVEYDIESAYLKIKDAGLPLVLAQRLLIGR